MVLENEFDTDTEPENLETTELAKRYHHLNKTYRGMKKHRDEMASVLKERLDLGVHDFGPVAVVIKSQSREYPDRDKLKERGLWDEFSYMTTFNTIETVDNE